MNEQRSSNISDARPDRSRPAVGQWSAATTACPAVAAGPGPGQSRARRATTQPRRSSSPCVLSMAAAPPARAEAQCFICLEGGDQSAGASSRWAAGARRAAFSTFVILQYYAICIDVIYSDSFMFALGWPAAGHMDLAAGAVAPEALVY
jgi:cyclophilin family peptidyl-prolyl cis-trans isomerase